MVNILRFPGSSKADTSQHHSVDDFRGLFADDSAMVFTAESAFPMLKPRPTACLAASGDWTNQELADLYRVEALLSQAGMRLETARGLTDEDDPWFVFCSQDGDVFVHLARVDGHYLLDSPGLGSPIYGDDFNELVDMFVRHQAAIAPSGNVVRFRPGSNKDGVVRLHPAMMMAALIWTLYLASDHFVGTAEAAENGDAGQTGLDQHVGGVEEHFISAPALQTYIDHDDHSREQVVSGRGFGPDTRNGAQTGSLVGNSVAASLSAIAASWGLFDPQLGSLPELSELQQIGSAQLKMDLEERASSVPHDNQSGHIASNEHENSDGGPLGKPEALKGHEPEPTYVGLRASTSPEMQVTLTKVVVPLETHQAPDTGTGIMTVNVEAIAANAPAVIPLSHQGSDSLTSPSEVQTLLKLAGMYAGETEKYTLGNVNFTATFNVASLGKNAAEFVLSQLPVSGGAKIETGLNDAQSVVLPGASPSPIEGIGSIVDHSYIPPHVATYNASAKDFVHKFLLESPHVEMIKVDNAIIFVDTTAIDEATDVTAVRSWSLDDAITVSTIGHADYFAKYFYLDYYLA